MNAGFVNVKVDREERPDVDAVYMEATQAMTGQWRLADDLLAHAGRREPFYAGTYLPRPQLRRSARCSASTAWRDQRRDIVESGQRVLGALTRRGPARRGPAH